MDTTSPTPPGSRTKTLLFTLSGIIAGAIITVALTTVFVRRASGMGLLQLMSMFHAGPTQVQVDQPTVVRQIRQLQRLETVSYTMDKIIGGGKDNPYLPRFLVGDRLLLLVHGEVVAGVDLSKVQPGDIGIEGRSVSIHLPAAEVFSTRVDNARTRVYSRDTGVFSSADPNLETQVRQEGERQLEQSALQDGILKAADQNARQTICGMLQGLGFDQVNVR
jgi:hypothetical protein